MQFKIKHFLHYCYDDTDSIDFQLFLITVKCLVPYEDNIGCCFDVNRYRKEIELFAYYMNRSDETIEYWLKHKKPSNIDDELMEFKIIPIILTNTMWENIIDEVFKAVTFYTYNKNTILNSLLISSAIFEFLKNTETENIEKATKERLINFSAKDFFTKNLLITDKNYIIEFEKERIKLISKFKLYADITEKSKALKYIFENTPVIVKESKASLDNELSILNSFSEYLFKLRKGTINPEKLKISDKIPDIKECLKQPLFNHPLLGRCKVIQRTEKEVIIKNKSGLMRIRI